MKCFKVVQRVLEDTYDSIPGSEPERDAAVAAALKNLSSTYAALHRGSAPDFGDPTTRFAYVYKYVPGHAHWVYSLLSSNGAASAPFERPRVRVACIGGGPGSDLVGILKFLDERGEPWPNVFCEIVDGCEQWKATWSDVAFSLDLPGTLHTDYVIHRVGDPNVWTHPNKIAQADILTLSFFVSEISTLGAPAWDYIATALRISKSGAALLFNDNNNAIFYTEFDRLADEAGWDVRHSDESNNRIYDSGEQKTDLGRFFLKFGEYPRLTANMASRILVKR